MMAPLARETISRNNRKPAPALPERAFTILSSSVYWNPTLTTLTLLTMTPSEKRAQM